MAAFFISAGARRRARRRPSPREKCMMDKRNRLTSTFGRSRQLHQLPTHHLRQREVQRLRQRKSSLRHGGGLRFHCSGASCLRLNRSGANHQRQQIMPSNQSLGALGGSNQPLQRRQPPLQRQQTTTGSPQLRTSPSAAAEHGQRMPSQRGFDPPAAASLPARLRPVERQWPDDQEASLRNI